MLNPIIQGVAAALHASFGDGYRVYQNDVRQGLTEPSFLVAVLQPELSPLVGARYLSRNPLDVHYFPKEPRSHAEMVEVAETLLEVLEYITLPDGGLLRGTGMRYEIVDDVLHFFVSYNHTVYRAEELPTMETLEVLSGTKEERER